MRATPQRPRNPLEPVSTAVATATGLVALFIGLSLFVPSQGWGHGPVCTTAPYLSVPLTRAQTSEVAVTGLARTSQSSIQDVSICASHPGALLRLAGVLTSLPSLALLLGALIIVRRLLRAAERPDGLYTLDTARRVRFLGWFLTVGALTAAILESVARTVVLTSQIHYPGVNWLETDQWGLPVATLLAGLVMITLARIMSVGVTMRQELDVTI